MLVLDGWLSLNHCSIWNFTILTLTHKEYIIQLSDLSADSHTSDFITKKIEVIINCIGLSKFAAIISDNGANV